MELHGFERQVATTHAQDHSIAHAVRGLRRHIEASGQLFGNRVQRGVVPAHREFLRQSFGYAGVVATNA